MAANLRRQRSMTGKVVEGFFLFHSDSWRRLVMICVYGGRRHGGILVRDIRGTEAVVVWQVADDIASSTQRQISFNSSSGFVVSQTDVDP